MFPAWRFSHLSRAVIPYAALCGPWLGESQDGPMPRKQATFHSWTETLDRETEQTRPIPSSGPERGRGGGRGGLCVRACALPRPEGAWPLPAQQGHSQVCCSFQCTCFKSARSSQNPTPMCGDQPSQKQRQEGETACQPRHNTKQPF